MSYMEPIRNRAWLDPKTFHAIRWSAWATTECVQAYFELTDGNNTIHIHSDDKNPSCCSTDFKNKLKIVLTMLDRFLQIDPKVDDEFTLRSWLNPETSTYSGSMITYLKKRGAIEISLGLKISCCSQSISWYPDTDKSIKQTKAQVKKIVAELNKLFAAIEKLESNVRTINGNPLFLL